MTGALEDRIQRLERFRYRMLGMVNAQNALIEELMCDLMRRESVPIAAIEALRRELVARGDAPSRALHAVNPVEGDLIAQEYREALDQLATTIAARLRRHRPPES